MRAAACGGIGNGGEGNGAGGSSGAGGSRLRGSVPLRTRSVRTFHVAAVSLLALQTGLPLLLEPARELGDRKARNIAGTGAYDVYRQAETTVTYTQTIERGGKRDARIAYAERDIGVAEASARLTRLDLAEAVQRTFIDLQIAEEVVWLAERRLETERAMQTEALRRVRGYKDPLFVETRAEARVAQARLALDEARSRRNAARARLASFWGGKAEDVEVPRGIEKPDDHLHQLAAADSALASATVERAQAAVVVKGGEVLRQPLPIAGPDLRAVFQPTLEVAAPDHLLHELLGILRPMRERISGWSTTFYKVVFPAIWLTCFGSGAVEGIVAPEVAAGAKEGGAFIPATIAARRSAPAA